MYLYDRIKLSTYTKHYSQLVLIKLVCEARIV